jgi:hypothetical protein
MIQDRRIGENVNAGADRLKFPILTKLANDWLEQQQSQQQQ